MLGRFQRLDNLRHLGTEAVLSVVDFGMSEAHRWNHSVVRLAAKQTHAEAAPVCLDRLLSGHLPRGFQDAHTATSLPVRADSSICAQASTHRQRLPARL